MYGQFFVSKWGNSEVIDFSFRTTYGLIVNVTLDEEQLASSTWEAELRSKVRELFRKCTSETPAKETAQYCEYAAC